MDTPDEMSTAICAQLWVLVISPQLSTKHSIQVLSSAIMTMSHQLI